MSKHIRPQDVAVAEFWTVACDDDVSVFTTLKAAEDSLLRCMEGTTIWHCQPDQARMVDITADLAQQWYEASHDVYDDAPEVYEPYIGADVLSRRDDYEERGCRRNIGHSTYYRGIGI